MRRPPPGSVQRSSVWSQACRSPRWPLQLPRREQLEMSGGWALGECWPGPIQPPAFCHPLYTEAAPMCRGPGGAWKE